MSKNKHSKLWIYFSLLVLATTLFSVLLIAIIWIVLYKLNIISIGPVNPIAKRIPIVWLFFSSILIGTVTSTFVGKIFIKPMERLKDIFDQVSKGNFSVRVNENQDVREIREMAHCFNSMVNELSNMETLSNDFVVNVSHEFKTPIASIEGYATLLQEKNLSEERRERYLQKILDNSRRLSNLSSSILALSKLENQGVLMNKSTYRLDEQLRKIVLLLEPRWSEKNIDIDIHLPKYNYYGNEQLLEQVWVNIIDNAIKNTDELGKITIRLYPAQTGVTVLICDTGCGMNEEVKKHLFDKFYQGDPSRKAEGNGLGLSIVKRIVDLSNGEIAVESKQGKGTAFTVYLP